MDALFGAFTPKGIPQLPKLPQIRRQPTKDSGTLYFSDYQFIGRDELAVVFKELQNPQSSEITTTKYRALLTKLNENIERAKQYRTDFDNMVKYTRYVRKQNTHGLPGGGKIINGFFRGTPKWDYDGEFVYELKTEPDKAGIPHSYVIRTKSQHPPVTHT